ncbi:MAG: DUF4956 domain-containing protein [Hydrogenophilaceae bacterium]|jgi:hypothetical protein|nr:DUF4956 domain-containing protein [Hydrogenophilaceae bacterium]
MATDLERDNAERGTEPAPAPERATALAKLFAPYLIISAYYAAAAGLTAAFLWLNPAIMAHLPVGGAADFVAASESAFEPVMRDASPLRSTFSEAVKLALSMVAAFALMLPVTWVCMGARRRKDVSQSFVQTILVLPLVITGIVHVVHNSLALAFSLAGIVAGVRFRHTLKDSAETTYLFTAIGVGVACGINAVEVAAIISIFFNYAVLGLWATDFGAATTGKQMFSRQWMAKEPLEKPNRKERKPEDDDDDD